MLMLYSLVLSFMCGLVSCKPHSLVQTSLVQSTCDGGVACGTVDDSDRRTSGGEDPVDPKTRVEEAYWMLVEIISMILLVAGGAVYRKSQRKRCEQYPKACSKSLGFNPACPGIPASYRKNCTTDGDAPVMQMRVERKITMIINSKATYPDGPQQACKVLDDMKKKGTPPNLIHYGAAIGVCAKKEFAFDVALNLLDDMRRNKVKPDVVCFNAAITSCARSNQCDLAFQLLNEMSDEGLIPQLVTVNAVLDACAKAGQEEKARRLLERMPTLGLQPTVTTYGTVINAVAKVGNWEGALTLIDQMDRAGIEGTIQCYSAAINACAKSARSKPALQILRMMIQRGVTPNQICWSTAINACLKGGQDELALGLLDEMKMAGVTPDDVTYHVLIRDLKKSGSVSRDTILALQAERSQYAAGTKARPDQNKASSRLDLRPCQEKLMG